MSTPLSGMGAEATFSPDRVYRYSLRRIWSDRPACMFVGLNPSTADENSDDRTIRKCIKFARRWGFGGLVMANAFAFRATDPRDLRVADDPIGPDNDATLRELAQESKLIVACWGEHISWWPGRDAQVLELLGEVRCLDYTLSGRPRHPLYIRDETPHRAYKWRS